MRRASNTEAEKYNHIELTISYGHGMQRYNLFFLATLSPHNHTSKSAQHR